MRGVLAVVVLLAAIVATGVPAFADTGGDPNAAANFGQCVMMHAMDPGFSGEMNPGMHQGNSGDHHDDGCPW